MPRKPDQLVALDDARSSPESSKPLFGLDAEQLSTVAVEAGEPAWRAKQIVQAIYREHVTELNEISTLPRPFREKLISTGWAIARPRISQVFRSVDGTERYLVECPSNLDLTQTVETVWMPEGDGGESGDDASDSAPPVLASGPAEP